jgi:hypothetical protein
MTVTDGNIHSPENPAIDREPRPTGRIRDDFVRGMTGRRSAAQVSRWNGGKGRGSNPSTG